MTDDVVADVVAAMSQPSYAVKHPRDDGGGFLGYHDASVDAWAQEAAPSGPGVASGGPRERKATQTYRANQAAAAKRRRERSKEEMEKLRAGVESLQVVVKRLQRDVKASRERAETSEGSVSLLSVALETANERIGTLESEIAAKLKAKPRVRGAPMSYYSKDPKCRPGIHECGLTM